MSDPPNSSHRGDQATQQDPVVSLLGGVGRDQLGTGARKGDPTLGEDECPQKGIRMKQGALNCLLLI